MTHRERTVQHVRQTIEKLQIQVHLILHDNLMTHFLGKVPVVFKTKELSNTLDRQLKWLEYISFIIGKIMKLM